MGRTRQSAKQAGSRFERAVADYLRDTLDDRIDRKVKTGALDKGDIANVRTAKNSRITIECKDYGGRLQLPQWIKEAHTEATNDNTLCGVVVAKRRGTAKPEEQWAILTLGDLVKILGEK